MNLIASQNLFTTAVDIDSLLQDSYLLVVELRQGSSAQNSNELAMLCGKQIESVRQHLKDAGLSQRNIDHISHAQCALLDETVLTWANPDTREKWASEPLQAKFFSRHQAGEFLYEDMREVLREPAPDMHVLTVFQRILMLGFQGRYREVNHPERMQLISALNAQVVPLQQHQVLPTAVGRSSKVDLLQWTRSPMIHALAAGVLLAGFWWSVDHFLSGLIASILLGSAA